MTDTSNDIQIPSSLYKKADYAFKYAINALESADPLVPFAISWQSEVTSIERFMQGAYDDSIELAMRAINEADESVNAYAVVWAGYVEVNDKKVEAVIAEVSDKYVNESVQLAQPYTYVGAGVQKQGDMLALGSAPNLLTSKLSAFNMDNHLIKPAYSSSEGFKNDIISQPYAKIPAAVICLAANLFTDNEAEYLTTGIHKLQALESREEYPALSRRVFSNVISILVEDDGFTKILKTDKVTDMAKTILDGAAQLNHAVQKGLLAETHAKTYFEDMRTLLHAVLTDNDKQEPPEGADKLESLLEKAFSA